MPEIKAFNTRRQYSSRGQRIAYCVLTTGNVAMVDVDRNIDYVLLHRPDIPVRHGTVLALYDANKSAPYDARESAEFSAVRMALESAAHAL